MSQGPSPQDWQALADAFCDGTLTPRQNEQLVSLLESDGPQLHEFVQYMDMHAELQWQRRGSNETIPDDWPSDELDDLGQLIHAKPDFTHTQSLRRRSNVLAIGLLAAAVCALAATLWILVWDQEPGHPFRRAHAQLMGTREAEWSGLSIPEVGKGLPKNTLILKSGFAEIQMASGVTVVLEGPCRFAIPSTNRLELAHGKMTATVPTQAHGFTVKTPDQTFIDLGTTFGIETVSKTRTELHVMHGRVRIDGNNPTRVAAHQAFATAKDQSPASIPFEPYRFFAHLPSAEELAARQMLGRNLVVNGDAESTSAAEGLIPGWTVGDGLMRKAPYKQVSDNPEEDDLRFASPGPSDRGRSFFRGSPNPHNTMHQTIDLGPLARAIDENRVVFRLAGWFGGWMKQRDRAFCRAEFLAADGTVLWQTDLGPVTAQDRQNITQLMHRMHEGSLRPGTRSVRLRLHAIRQDGKENDGYSDNLSLVVWTKPAPTQSIEKVR